MKSKSLIVALLVAVAAIVVYLQIRAPQTPAPAAETAQPAAPAEPATAPAAPAAPAEATGTDAGAATAPQGQNGCTQYSWNGAAWVCSQGAVANN